MLSTLAAITVAHWGGPWVGGFGWLFLLIPLFWIAVFVLLFVFVGRRWRHAAASRGPYGYGYGHGWGPGMGSRSAEATLAQRFANGDIDEVEYRARLEVLRANRENQG
ncbi:MAG TPA: hypothetical protein VGN33_13495 [Leifsonia sp.]|nr:hypothetical protein [Leifsonia sp.]